MSKDLNLRIDILLPTYNGAKYIEDQIESILNQTYKNFFLIICDDNSKDDTVRIIKKYMNKNDNIILKQNKNNLGYIKNFEKLIKISNARYFMLCDQDDVWKADKIKQSLKAIRKNNVDLVFTDLHVVDDNLNILEYSFNDSMQIKADSIRDIYDIRFRNYATGCTMLCDAEIKKILIPFIELEEPVFIHDWYILLISSMSRGFHYINEKTVYYRQHGSNSLGYRKRNLSSFIDKVRRTRKMKTEFIYNRLKLYERLEKRFPGKFGSEIAYLNCLKKTRLINFSFNNYYKFFKNETLKMKLIYLIAFHFPMEIFKYSDSK